HLISCPTRRSSDLESLVRFCHAVYVFTLLNRRAFAFAGVQHLIRQTLRHGFFTTLTGSINQPAHGQCLTAGRTHFNRYLVSSTTHTTGFYFHHRLDRFQGFFEQFQSVTALFFCHDIHSAVNDFFGDGFFTTDHHVVHEFGQSDISELRIRQDFALRSDASSWHDKPS